MKRQAIILNFDHGTAKYVPVEKMPKPKHLVATASGSSPPAQTPQTPPKK